MTHIIFSSKSLARHSKSCVTASQYPWVTWDSGEGHGRMVVTFHVNIYIITNSERKTTLNHVYLQHVFGPINVKGNCLEVKTSSLILGSFPYRSNIMRCQKLSTCSYVHSSEFSTMPHTWVILTWDDGWLLFISFQLHSCKTKTYDCWYGWWKKSCTSWYGKYPIIYSIKLFDLCFAFLAGV